MNKNIKTRWFVDALLFSGFILAFFLNITGLGFHQWIGVASGAIAGYHLVTHWNWVTNLTQRLFGKVSARSRAYYVIDTALLFGFATILLTGLVISSWLNLALANYAAWRAVHIVASIVTLLVVIAKLVLHWRWIAWVQKSIFSAKGVRRPETGPAQTAGFAGAADRREFLKAMGVVGVSSVIALSQSVGSLQSTDTSESTTAGSQTVGSIQFPDLSQLLGSDQDSSSSTCAVRCNRKCSYPGHCHKYRDTNGNNRCDLGECA